jgi:transcriptional regulator of acetoin/glycerol metabolism
MLAEMVRAALKKLSPGDIREFFALVARDEPLDAETIARALEITGGHIGRAAMVLGVSRRTFQKRMRDFGLEPARAGRKFK